MLDAVCSKSFYDGRDFAGSQVQPKQRTVEGEILKVLEKAGACAEKFQRACRTDRGVSAAGNVFAVATDIILNAGELNSRLPEDICILDIKKVSEDFNPRHARGRYTKCFRRQAQLPQFLQIREGQEFSEKAQQS